MNNYDIITVGSGSSAIYGVYTAIKRNPNLKILCIDKGKPLNERLCPISLGKTNKCINCKPCSIMNGFGGCGAFSDFKYPITNDFGGFLFNKIGKDKALNLMRQADSINIELLKKYNISVPSLYTTTPELSKLCIKNGLKLMYSDIRHLGSDTGKKLMAIMYEQLKILGVSFMFNTEVVDVLKDDMPETEYSFNVKTSTSESYRAKNVILAVGRSGSHWLSEYCKAHSITTSSNRVDLGVRVELPAEVFSDITDKVYESKIVYTTEKYQDTVRTFCMNPYGFVVNENTNGFVTVNGHSNSENGEHSENTNFALLVSQHFTEPFNNSNEYGESIAKLSNMLGGGAIVQRLGDLERGQRSTQDRIDRSTVRPTLKACPGDLSLVLPKRILDDIIEMIHALDRVAPGTANDDTLLYGVEVKFYNMEVAVDNNLEVPGKKGLYIVGDGSGITHSLSQASASGLYVAEKILENYNTVKNVN